ncbi:hypothetical protein M4L90_07120 [Staphylococcus equorum]|uniref:Uncharacterized protein n=1 Tax=Staphylococcus equorum TaxID=246432 RepID=A0A9X4L8X8_9STAP|nr:hypothetical protein [Staphylococcus equorum]MDG0819670.1 hypothetical protein [Staphylococcus equorum]MDG0840311.1 hypothetical protein [Staphylococcus equorum]MDG0845994.1 hypothetical protein [Staphylococcus equorum]
MDTIKRKISYEVKDIFSHTINSTIHDIKKQNEKKEGMDITNPIRECLHSLIDQQIWRLSQKTFVYEFHEYRKK